MKNQLKSEKKPLRKILSYIKSIIPTDEAAPKGIELTDFGVSIIKAMFLGEEEDLSYLDVSKAKDMHRMFPKLKEDSLHRLDLSHFDFSARHQNKMHPNIDPKNLKVNKEKETRREKDIDKE
ncbi:hypothetical protein KTQ89_06990 [Holdemanella porci]|uniref:hypothetical protein n=1 Tax=Holdemanella porci TaxID=2652276 RepID=UPI001C2BA452|nr:hypothetical protein [Holdemanella porci]MBU9872098.1 hypothetical protein [Holdemanella porci]